MLSVYILFICLSNLLVLAQESRIVNGTEVNPKFKYPFMVSLDYHGKHVCGGTLINKNTVITAAHCINATESDWTISYHRHNMNLTSSQEGGQNLKILKRIPHPKYFINTTHIAHDIAVYKVETVKDFHYNVRLDNKGIFKKNGQLLKVMGWGRLYENGPYAYVLRETQVPVYNIDKCKKAYPTLDTESQFCAGFEEGGTDSCQADSGGPLLYKDYYGYTFVGVVSWGNGCALKGFPGIYTTIQTATDFIKQHA